MADRPTLLRRGGPWARVVIFISLYIMLLESLTEWVLVIYLHVIKQVDSKMTPSLVLALVASFFTVPLVALHSLAAWQYNRIVGFGTQKAILHASCTYILRLTVALWLAASVAGLVVASQQASCLPDDDAGGGFWNQGVSCTLHRTVVIVTVVSFVTVCIFFCSRELCDRPYDISLLGVYKQQQANRDGSIFSSTSSESENVFKNDVLCLCRHPDTASGPYWSPMDINFTEKPACKPSIKHPRPIHPRPLLTLDTTPVAEPPLSPNETLVTDPYPVSRSSTLLATPTSYQRQAPPPVAELSAASAAPSTSSKPAHKRGKSSLSSLMRFIPKSQPTTASLPLSADPRIRELSDPDLRHGLENDPTTTPSSTLSPTQPATDAQPPSTSTPIESSPITHRRSMTTSSSDAPEVVPPAPKTPRPQTQPPLQLQQFSSIHHPHHPNYLPYPHQSRTSMPPHLQPPRKIPPSHSSPHSPNRHPTTTTRRQSTSIYHFDPSQRQQSPSPYHNHHLPRHSQSQHLPHSYYHRRRMEPPSRNYLYSHRLRRSNNDVEILYPSTRRPRSSMGMGMGMGSGRLDSIEEVTRGSVDENSYRGADRTSFVGI